MKDFIRICIAYSAEKPGIRKRALERVVFACERFLE